MVDDFLTIYCLLRFDCMGYNLEGFEGDVVDKYLDTQADVDNEDRLEACIVVDNNNYCTAFADDTVDCAYSSITSASGLAAGMQQGVDVDVDMDIDFEDRTDLLGDDTEGLLVECCLIAIFVDIGFVQD